MRDWLKLGAILILVPGILCAAPQFYSPSNEIPFPWGSEAPFPWSDIEGVWQANFDGQVVYYSFRVVSRPNPDHSVLEVLVVNLQTHTIYGRGTGITGANSRIVDALVDIGGKNHRILIRAYEKELSHGPQLVTVATDQLLSDGPTIERHSVLSKIEIKPIAERR